MTRERSETMLHGIPCAILALLYVVAVALLPAFPLSILAFAAAAIGAARSDRPLRYAMTLAALVLPLGLASVLVAVAGPRTAGEPVWVDGLFWAIGLPRVVGVVSTTARFLAVIAAGLGLAAWLTTTRIRQLVGDLRLPQALARIAIGSLAWRASLAIAARQVADAQQLRGVRIRGALWHRARALPPLAIPLVSSAFTDAAARSASWERRGYHAYIDDIPEPRRMTARDRGTIGVAATVFALVCWASL